MKEKSLLGDVVNQIKLGIQKEKDFGLNLISSIFKKFNGFFLF